MAGTYVSGQIGQCRFSPFIGTVKTWCLKRALALCSYSHFDGGDSGAPLRVLLWLDLPDASRLKGWPMGWRREPENI